MTGSWRRFERKILVPKAVAKRSAENEFLHEAQARSSAEKLFHDLLDAAPDAILEVDSRYVPTLLLMNCSVTTRRSC
jgi:hypothetical protein